MEIVGDVKKPALIACAVAGFAVVLTLVCGAMEWRIPGGVFKMSASCAFLVVAYFSGAFNTRYGMVVFFGLVASWFGDLFLIFPGMFLAGLIAFFLGHLAYAAAFLIFGMRLQWTAAAALFLFVPVLLIGKWLIPHLPEDMRIPVFAYMAVITTMVTLAAGAVGKGAPRMLLLGAVLFYVSDICVARQAFVEPSYLNPLFGLPLYFGGQVLIAYSIAGANEKLGQPALKE